MTVIDYGLTPPADFTPIPDSILEASIVSRFEEMAETYPNQTALESEAHRLSYLELNRAANDLARRIQDEMGSDNSPVAFLFQDEVFSVAAVLAILKSGRVFVGLHRGNTREQLAAFVDDSTAALLIASPDLRGEAQAILRGRERVKTMFVETLAVNSTRPNPAVAIRPGNHFAIFYTSGSTGQPKGILLSHAYLTQMAHYMARDWFFSPSDRVALVTSVCYLAAFTSLLGALMNGGTLCMLDLKQHSAQAALDWMREARLTVFRCTPSIFRTVFAQAPAGRVYPLLRFLTLGGEPVSATDVELFKAHTADDCVLINNFAATEAGLICHYPVSHRTPAFAGFLPAGYPAPGKEILLLDQNGKEVARGQEGEIVVRSQYLSLGYWRQPELTAQKFHPDPKDARFGYYFTADRGRLLENGALEVLGRMDTQVKIRGFRVQLEEVDLALRSFPGVVDAAAVVHRPPRGAERLAAYVCLRGTERLSVGRMRGHLAAQLPAYMIPSAFVQMDSLPRTPTGKLARAQLPEPSTARPELGVPLVAPRNPAEAKLAGIWGKALNLESVGVHDDFFELGGDSLLASEVFVEIERQFAKRYPMNVLLQHGTIAALAERMQTLDAVGPSSIVPLRAAGTLPPIFLAPGGGADVISFMELVEALGPDQPAYGFQDFNVETQESIYVQGVERTAQEFIKAMKAVRPAGPYHLLGHSAGGLIAFEMAKQLRAEGEAAGLLGLLDSAPPRKRRARGKLRDRLLVHAMNVDGMDLREQLDYFLARGRAFLGRRLGAQKAFRKFYQAKWADKILWRDPMRFAHGLMEDYFPEPYDGPAVIYQVTRRSRVVTWDVTAPWKQFIRGGVAFHNVPGNHNTMIKNPHVQTLAELIRAHLREANAKAGSGREIRAEPSDGKN